MVIMKDNHLVVVEEYPVSKSGVLCSNGLQLWSVWSDILTKPDAGKLIEALISLSRVHQILVIGVGGDLKIGEFYLPCNLCELDSTLGIDVNPSDDWIGPDVLVQ